MSEEEAAAADSGGTAPVDFIRTIVREDIDAGVHAAVVTRFPPEPNGFLHIGHAKAICLNFGIAGEFAGHCNLRFDDTNPETEDPRFVEAIKDDIRWLGFEWDGAARHASDYFEQLYEWALLLIRRGKAYVDDLSEAEIRERRGTVTEPGTDSPFRDREVEENLDLFGRMRAGEFPDGSRVLRARIDMAHPNMKMRDPLMYRVRHAPHYRRGEDWPIYPFYDWAHGQSDAIEGVTHSLCTLEFENNRELYDWFLDNLELTGTRPRQYEFARLNVDYTITSKRRLLRLVEEARVDGWDDPRMPTIAGMRRRGVPPAALRRFCDLVGVAKADSRVDFAMLDFAVRDELNTSAPRVMCVLRPLRVVITNWPEDQVDELEASYWPRDVPREGTRTVPFGREILVEADDFQEDPEKGFFRLAPGREVRLRYGYVIRCDEVVKDDDGKVVELRCSYDPDTRGGDTPDGRRVRGTIHWVAAATSVPVQVRLYDRLFRVPEPGQSGDLLENLNPDSLEIIQEACAEPALAALAPGEHVQFERTGYFYSDPARSAPGKPVFNRVVTLRDTWASATDEAAPQPGRVPETPAADGDDARKRKKKSPVEVRAEARAADPARAEAYVRLQSEHDLDEESADVLSGDPALTALFDAAVGTGAAAATVAKWTLNEVLRLAKDDGVEALRFGGAELGAVVQMVERDEIPARAAKQVFAEMADNGGEPAAIVARLGLDETLDTDELRATVARVVAAHADKAAEYRGGRTGLLGFFVGQVMRETGGSADPEAVQALLQTTLQHDGSTE